MPDRFTGTMLTKINTQGGLPEDPAKAFGKMSEETDKALLDILKKVNELAGTSADASATGSTLSGLGGALSSAIKGMKYGLDNVYVSSDTLSILPGAVEVNGELVVCPNAMAITSGMPNFPAAGSWAYVTMEKGGTHRLFPATGAATIRPSDACYQWTGGGVGFLDLGKQGYYYDTKRRIIGAIHRVSATTWYTIVNGQGANESGINSLGSYIRYGDGMMEEWGWDWIWQAGMSNYSMKIITFPTAFYTGTAPSLVPGAGGIKAYASGVPTFPGDTPAGHQLNSIGHDFNVATPAQQVRIMLIRGAVSALTDIYYYVVTWIAMGRWRA